MKTSILELNSKATMKTPIIVIAASLVLALGMLWYFNSSQLFIADKADKEKKIANSEANDTRWELPTELDEISGLVYLQDGLFACVQDEKGVIYIYSTAESKIVQKVPFAKDGDFEGLAIKGKNAYVVRSDGELFIIKDYRSKKPRVSQHVTFLDEDNNVEGVGFDAANNRLLITVKDEDPEGRDYKGIYAFDLKNMQMDKNPVIKIRFDDSAFGKDGGKDEDKVFNPSGIDISEKTGDIYITDGKKSKIAILNKEGKIKKVISLDEDEYHQPEGITLNNNGTVFISNEGKKGKANIIQMTNME